MTSYSESSRKEHEHRAKEEEQKQEWSKKHLSMTTNMALGARQQRRLHAAYIVQCTCLKLCAQAERDVRRELQVCTACLA